MKELPKKWCVMLDSLNYKTLFDWAEFTFKYTPENHKYITYEKCHGSGTLLHTYEIITFEDFKKLVLKEKTMNKLPKGYIVRCYSREECRDVYKNFYNDGFELLHWNYITCSSLIDHAQFKEKGLINSGQIIMHSFDCLDPRLKKLPVFKYTEYVKLREETMTKQDFTIEGTEALKKAFVEESGLTDNYGTPWNANKYMTSRAWGKKGFDAVGGFGGTRPIHFILPSQWEEALQYVKEYFAEDKFENGDSVVVVSTNTYNYGKSCGSDTPIIGNVYVIDEADYQGTWVRLFSPNGKIAIESKDLRKATSEEIKASKTKTFKLGDFTAVVSKDKVTIADRGSVTISECIKWFEKEFTVGNDKYSSLGEFAVTENTYTLNLGCVKNAPVKDIEEVYKYLKTL